MAPGVFQRLVAGWPQGTGLAALALLALTPAVAAGRSEAFLVAWLSLPAYMLHQFEEHDDDRFRRFVNERIGGGRELLTQRGVFWINVPLVWGVQGGSILGVALMGPAMALPAIYLMAVNAPVHIIQAIAMRGPNPGLWTAVFVFVPLCLWGFAATAGAGLGAHLACAALAVGAHALIARSAIARYRAAEG